MHGLGMTLVVVATFAVSACGGGVTENPAETGDGTSGSDSAGESASADSGEGDTTTSGDGDGTTSGDGDTTSGDGDGDGTTGDGDGTTGDGDGSTGDGTTGDGDGTTGDGDGTTGDGDGTTGDGDGDGTMDLCEQSGDPNDPPDPGVQGTAVGTNGTFVDECDSGGNLIEYFCETEMICGPPPNPFCETFETGLVVSSPFDCNGGCVDGVCPTRCPDFGDTLLITATAGGTTSFLNQMDGRTYDCTVIFDQPADTYDCATDPTVNDVFTIMSLGLSTQYCTGGNFGNIGVGVCTFNCALT